MNQLLKNNLLFGTLFTSFSTPFIFFMMGLPMILQMKGFEGSFIGFFQLIGIPTVIKFLLSQPIDRIVFNKNHYKKWVYLISIVYILLLIFISFLSLDENIYVVFGAIFVTALISTFLDIPLNALTIKVFNKSDRISAGSYKISGFFLAGLLGGGVFLLVYNHLGWQSTFLIMAGMVGLSLISLSYIDENNEKIEEKRVSFKTILSFFTQKDIGIWVFILSFYFAFISAVWIFMKPYLISKGMKPDDVAIYVGIYGGTIGFIGGIVTSEIGKRFSKKTLLITFMGFNILSVLVLITTEYLNLTVEYFLLAITFTALAIALSSAIIFSMIMDYSRSSSRGIDYSIQASLFALTRIISAIIGGILVSSIGFGGMFIVEMFCMIILLVFIFKYFHGE
ncbi:MAG: MFS transporter [Campylobacterales bacterium]|nr:MFS transporter [Campylobacterales bacterium]